MAVEIGHFGSVCVCVCVLGVYGCLVVGFHWLVMSLCCYRDPLGFSFVFFRLSLLGHVVGDCRLCFQFSRS